MLGHCLRRWPNIKPAQLQRLLFLLQARNSPLSSGAAQWQISQLFILATITGACVPPPPAPPTSAIRSFHGSLTSRRDANT